jgi:hypothetical protein
LRPFPPPYPARAEAASEIRAAAIKDAVNRHTEFSKAAIMSSLKSMLAYLYRRSCCRWRSPSPSPYGFCVGWPSIGWVRRIWHPALFEFSVFLIVLTITV